MERQSEYHDRVLSVKVSHARLFVSIERGLILLSHSREQQAKYEPCSEMELIAIRACAATLCCGIIKDEWFQKTVIPWLDQFMAAHEVSTAGTRTKCVTLSLLIRSRSIH